MNNTKKSLWSLLALIVSVSAVLAYLASDSNVLAGLTHAGDLSGGPVTIKTDLVQDKVLAGSGGQAAVALTLTAAEIEQPEHVPVRHADLVIVLDRSGSMKGQKINDARLAVLRLIDRLADRDRLALVTYANGPRIHFPLVAMDSEHRQRAKTAVQEIDTGGGTNLGGGLRQGIDILTQIPSTGRQRKVILISDGLANQGITEPVMLAGMASAAVEQNFSISTVGVGYDFNEVLMASIADHGAGRYYFLENPDAFAQVFEKEFTATRNVAATGMEIRIPLGDGLRLVNAGGYPVEVKSGHAVVHPGDLLSGQQRKLFLTFQVPTDRERNFEFGKIGLKYRHGATPFELHSREDLTLACVADEQAVMSSIDQAAWGDQVVQDDFNQLKEEVAEAVRKGEKDEALKQIHAYETRTRAINASVGSGKVASNLDKDVRNLQQDVERTFAGPPAAVAEKKKQTAKALQYDSYKVRRDKK